jgi:phosphate transport system protein
MSVRRPIDDELQQLHALLVEMADLVDEQFSNAINSVISGNIGDASEVVERDDEVDALELAIDRQCERILALHQPVSRELRMLIVAIKINTDLERIGDHCKNVAKNTKYLARAPEVFKQTSIAEMADQSRTMLREVQDAFLERDTLKARRVLAKDRHVDRMHRETFYKLIDLAKETPELMEAVGHVITMSKALERISDHAKNIAEAIVFLMEGIDIRHKQVQDTSDGGSGTSVADV